jgi:hypothetical protein
MKDFDITKVSGNASDEIKERTWGLIGVTIDKHKRTFCAEIVDDMSLEEVSFGPKVEEKEKMEVKVVMGITVSERTYVSWPCQCLVLGVEPCDSDGSYVGCGY